METPKADKSGAAPGASTNLFSKPKNDDNISDDYDDDFEDFEDKKKDAKPSDKAKKQDDDDDDYDWGDLEDEDDKKKKASDVAKKAEDKKDEGDKRQNMFFGSGGKYDDVPDLDDLPEIGSNFQNKDKFNQVMSSSKEGGGLLASIGLKKDDVKDG